MNHLKSAAYPLFCLLLSLVSVSSPAAGPWGSARVTATDYKPQKVVYDVSVDTERELTHVIDRASYLSKLTGADPFDSSIVLVLHGPEIRFFAIENFEANKELVTRAQSLTVGGTVKIRMCKIAAEGQGFAPEDLHGFVELVPMGDAEIVRLQNEEAHAYMR